MSESEKTEVIKIRIAVSTKKRVQEIASREYRSFAKQCQLILDEWLDNKK